MAGIFGEAPTAASSPARRLRRVSFRELTWATACGVPFLVASLLAQQMPRNGDLKPTEVLGRRVFQQRCGVCHTAPAITSGVYGPVLYKDLVEGNEDSVRRFIMNGSKRMPGFKYGLEPSEVDAVIAYLKTVPKPGRADSEKTDRGPID